MKKNRLQFFRKFRLPEDEVVRMKFLSEVPLFLCTNAQLFGFPSAKSNNLVFIPLSA